MENFENILRIATEAIERDYFLLPIQGAASINRERVYCYELYHQLRSRWKARSRMSNLAYSLAQRRLISRRALRIPSAVRVLRKADCPAHTQRVALADPLRPTRVGALASKLFSHYLAQDMFVERQGDHQAHQARIFIAKLPLCAAWSRTMTPAKLSCAR